jgi:hypothetical protein
MQPFGDKSDELSNIVMARSAATWPSIWKISVDCRSRQASFAMTTLSSFAGRFADRGNPSEILAGLLRRFALAMTRRVFGGFSHRLANV